jgi:hypothetical protein
MFSNSPGHETNLASKLMCKDFNKSGNNMESYDAHFKTCINIEDGSAITRELSERWLVTRMKISSATIKPASTAAHSFHEWLRSSAVSVLYWRDGKRRNFVVTGLRHHVTAVTKDILHNA